MKVLNEQNNDEITIILKLSDIKRSVARELSSHCAAAVRSAVDYHLDNAVEKTIAGEVTKLIYENKEEITAKAIEAAVPKIERRVRQETVKKISSQMIKFIANENEVEDK